MSFESVIKEEFGNTLEESAFAAETLTALGPYGFTADNTIACVAVCRDELCTPLKFVVREVWGEAFNLSGLAGVPFCGKTAFGAAHAHSPEEENKERYVYFSMAHIGIGPGGEPGECLRAGRAGKSKACGAVAALHGEIQSGKVELDHDADDLEQSLLRHRVLERLAWGATPGLVELTKIVRQEGIDTLERMVAATVDTEGADYAIFSGVQIHVPDGRTLVWPAMSYVVVNGERSALTLVCSDLGLL